MRSCLWKTQYPVDSAFPIHGQVNIKKAAKPVFFSIGHYQDTGTVIADGTGFNDTGHLPGIQQNRGSAGNRGSSINRGVISLRKDRL